MSSSVRQRGLRLLIISGSFFVALIGLFAWLETNGMASVPWVIAIPGGFALTGAIELATGTPFSEFDSMWGSLKGWHRGVLGMSILLAMTVLFVLAAAAYVLYTGT